LLVAIGRYSLAVDYYKEVGNAPWDPYKMRAGVAVGRALLAQDKVAEAKAAFKEVIDNPAQDVPAKMQRLAATVGTARCLAAEGQDEKAVDNLRKIIDKADPKQVRLHARAYNALGAAHRKAGRDKEALLAFLHTDLLYFGDPEAHAEALHNLAQLWEKMHKTERATQARTALQKLYRNSRWAKLGG
jgi:tetratricopeptide (TPR) repeat protein